MKLKLTKPIIFFDLETTGVNISRDRIVEISYIKVNPDGTEVSAEFRVNPEMPIPAESTAVHHITDADVADKKTFKQLAPELVKVFKGCDIAGYNSNRFDVPMLAEEFARANVDFDFSRIRFVDVQNIFHRKEQRTLVAAYRFYCGKELDNAHSANADTRATYEVLMAQLDRYDDLPNDIGFLSEFSSQTNNVDLAGRLIRNEKGEILINFGKYKGMPAKQVLETDSGYYGWIQQGDFTEDTKRAFTKLKLGQL
ncbi:MAG: 3'-5' exonuclease [Muribaculaceae bacterium]|nr:3'-5' exonuclease [Muribaculaceae bacterium]